MSKRRKMVVPVRVIARGESGQSTFLAHTLDASFMGARLGGFHGRLQVGETVTVQYQHRRSAFAVVWTGKRGTAQATQLGLRCLDPEKNIWNADLDDQEPGVGESRPSSSVMELRWQIEKL